MKSAFESHQNSSFDDNYVTMKLDLVCFRKATFLS